MINKAFFAQQQLAVGHSFNGIVQQYIQILAETIPIIKQSWQDNDLQQLSTLTHRLKGSSGSVGAEVLFTQLKEIERQAKAGEKIDIKLIEKLELTAKLTTKELFREL